ncbi:MAG: SDR family oxidoreductase [Pseudomonadota bacterium]|jgi:uncharacterized protein YbjT (DUF2867 family)|nr:SDR family oxidoreductase [Rubrivivax sp.]MCA3258438.1 SDR family oxidoreductase [Rubrivivax sp.]MCE2911860.1 SDR family oxidoreductase [Rubrivivax sp.]MCZ8031612.1 SDR family oxidoreductase [Rubrivivax sp.]
MADPARDPHAPAGAAPASRAQEGPDIGPVLVLGASGYVGSHLVPWLAARGVRVRAAARRADALAARAWPGVECVAADALDPASLDAALAGVRTAYYLVHSMAAGRDFPRLDRQAAIHFREAAARAGVRRIVYLGGLVPPGASSAHLMSRGETGEILRAGPVPVTELRAGIVIGPGSAAFEVIRDLVFHLPVMVTPRWVDSRSQPIALEDILEYLARVPLHDEAAGRVYDVGGPEVLTYRELMHLFASLVGKRRLIVPVPVLTPRLSSYWLDLVTAVPVNVARALIEGLEHDVIADDAAIRALLPLELKPVRTALQAAFDAERGAGGAADSPTFGRWHPGSMLYRQNRPDFAFYAKHMHGQAVAEAPPDAVWPLVEGIGGRHGYYFLDSLWALRGWLDRASGGFGLTRGRRDPDRLVIGDTIDFWRVVALERGHRLTLLAEMKLPGSAALEIVLHALDARRTRIEVTATFHPAGAPGLLYWHALTPAHWLIFPGLARAIASRAEGAAGRPTPP